MELLRKFFITIVPWYNVKEQMQRDAKSSSCIISARRAIYEAELVVVQHKSTKE